MSGLSARRHAFYLAATDEERISVARSWFPGGTTEGFLDGFVGELKLALESSARFEMLLDLYLGPPGSGGCGSMIELEPETFLEHMLETPDLERIATQELRAERGHSPKPNPKWRRRNWRS
jgi:hypothetical protein